MQYIYRTANLAFACLLGIGLSAGPVFAQGNNCLEEKSSDPLSTTYYGYGDTKADPDGSASAGTSTVIVTTTTSSYLCDNGNVQTRTVTTYDYVSGPGNSDYDAHDYETCEVTGDYFTCD
jgi:hypothetical protein